MAGFNNAQGKSQYAGKGQGQGSNRPGNFSPRGQGQGQGQKSEIPPTTHYMVTPKDEQGQKQYVNGVFITENETGMKIRVKEGIAPGTYYINKKKDKSEDAPKF